MATTVEAMAPALPRNRNGYQFGTHSWTQLSLVHPHVAGTAVVALSLSPVDFGVYEGGRDQAEQAENVERGVSWSLDSRHLPQPDGMYWAVDLVPWINGQYRWEWAPLYKVAKAMYDAAVILGTLEFLEWGGCWGPLPANPERAMNEYVRKRVLAGKPVRADGPHFQKARQ